MPQIDPDIGIILLAAGRGKRFGQDKLQQTYRGRPLWTFAAEAAENAGFAKRYLVRGPHSPAYLRAGWCEVVNPGADEGMGTSIAAGVAAAQTCTRLVVTLADMPLVDPAHLVRLAVGNGTVFTCYANGKSGSPAAFPAIAFSQLRSLAGDAGAKTLPLENVTAIKPHDMGSLRDVDTAQDLLDLD